MHLNNCPNCNGKPTLYGGVHRNHPIYSQFGNKKEISQNDPDNDILFSVMCMQCLIFTYEYFELEGLDSSWNTPHSLQIMKEDGTDDWGQILQE